MCLSAFVSALGSHEMGRHLLPIIIIIYVEYLSGDGTFSQLKIYISAKLLIQ